MGFGEPDGSVNLGLCLRSQTTNAPRVSNGVNMINKLKTGLIRTSKAIVLIVLAFSLAFFTTEACLRLTDSMQVASTASAFDRSAHAVSPRAIRSADAVDVDISQTVTFAVADKASAEVPAHT